MKILAIGTGIGGLTTAIALRRQGRDVLALERACELAGDGCWFEALA